MAKKKLDTIKRLFESQDTSTAMPEGYYSGDQPNPTIREFVHKHGIPFDSESDTYSVHPFSQTIATSKATAIYNMHTYWSKKPHDAITQYIRHFTRPNELILDPFVGSGGTALAAVLEGRHAIAIDLSPAATYIASNYVRPLYPNDVSSAGEALLAEFQKSDVATLFDTVCHESNRPALILRTVYSSRFRCKRCGLLVALFDCPTHAVPNSTGGSKETTVCPHCLKKGKPEELSAHNEWVDRIPVATEYRVGTRGTTMRTYNDSNKKAREFFEQYDLPQIARAAQAKVQSWYPQRYMLDVVSDEEIPWGLLWRPYHRGMRKVEHFFTKRNLHVISTLFSLVNKVAGGNLDIANVLRFGITGVLPGLSLLNRYRPDVSFPLNYSANTLYVPPVGTEENPIPHIRNKFHRIAEGYREYEVDSLGQCVVSTQDACHLENIPANSIDYIFTDPPYGYRIQYGELNFLWESWMNFRGDWRKNEIIINESETRRLFLPEWIDHLKEAMKECYRVLKPGRWLSLCFHDSSTEVWQAVQNCMAEAGFVSDTLTNVVAIETDYKTHKQHVAQQIAKRDLVLSFRKPNAGEWMVSKVYIPATADIPTFTEMASQVVRDFLTVHPGSTKDRVYDGLVSCLVRRGQMEAHNFDEILKSVAEEVQQHGQQGRWYLKESADQMDHAEQAKEEAAASCLAKFIGECLRKQPELEGVHYSDLFEQYLPIPDKPRREPLEWLPEFLVKTPSGTWRLASGEEAQQLAKLREAGTLRRIKRFANALIEGVPVRDKDRPGSDVDLLDWLRQCRRAGLYEQGKAIYEKGGLNSANLTDEQQIEAEDDYRICARRGSAEEAKPKRQRRKEQDDDE
jgi:DNA modification methylase